ncbi:LTA synthase family protein [Halomonas dongshanensis]|uniref:LTA synthase family protein n=1 Tax=Halomonas dongshanensis TaxID=2890835 RepID=A0ABT2EC66_9GAMM|nr:LTA synthase family protein [Halomonas dongshanensis]MCS2609164.1 LTA synthase family protein [Halomonas dongshanensis]
MLEVSLLWPLVTGLIATFAIEALLRPAPTPFWQRGMAATAMHVGSWLLLFGLFTLVLQRPWFAVVFLLSLQLVIVQSSNTKSSTLNEPFICHDFEYFWDALRHPRLYVPFFGVTLAILASCVGAAAIGAFLIWEPSLVSRHGAGALFVATLSLIAVGSALIVAVKPWRTSITLHPAQDMHALGLFASLWAYGVALMRARPPRPEQSPYYPGADQGADNQTDHASAKVNAQTNTPSADSPNVVLVQSESFFDPRSWCDEIAPSILAAFDTLRAQADIAGTLSVPAWGANTVRTECAVLTGIAPSAWGALQFNPYRTLARHPLPSIASAFKAAGYRTVCVHPYPETFYLRHRVMPALGFEQFVDLQAFDAATDRHGQYIGDAAVARKVGRLLEDDDNRPLFVFIITMENHGPLHLEAPQAEAAQQTLPKAHWPLAEHQRDLAVYLHHLREADRMMAEVTKALSSRSRPGLLGWYGDHVPILPAAYAHYGAPAGTTPYVIWSTQHKGTERSRPFTTQQLSAQELGAVLLERALGDVPNAAMMRDAPASDLMKSGVIKSNAITNDAFKAEPEFQEQE